MASSGSIAGSQGLTSGFEFRTVSNKKVLLFVSSLSHMKLRVHEDVTCG